ncbi:MAG: asparagine synthase (glutamine-hydrolyzing) [Candidatus Hydrothermae bacterium]|nr:asparagine synthase (glutamine-hydrolyzing) [Candidatus Hydrothermae bacterium]
MCGISGYQGQLEGFPREVLRHRGPDAMGALEEEGVGLFHCRLSIIDLSEAGRQPMANEDERLWLVFNGEIYNHQALREELEHRGHRFRSRSDAEVVLHGYETWGEEVLSRLRGMFAFALYDRERGELFLARDPFGIKPLVYAELPGAFVFASELRTLLGLPAFPRDLDETALQFYFRLNYIPHPHSVFRAARKLEPGHALRVRSGRVVAHRRWYALPHDPPPADLEEAKARLQETLQTSVRLHLIADVPVGAFLSGGLDSSLVVALAREHHPDLQTFTVAFPDVPAYDESAYARRVAEVLETRHTEIPVTADEARKVLEAVVNHLDEPFADSSLVPASIVSQVTRDHVKVALSGDGGDEFFAGYNKYQGLRLAAWLVPFRGLLRAVAALPLPERRGSRLGDRIRQLRKLARTAQPGPLFRLEQTYALLAPEDLPIPHLRTRPDPLRPRLQALLAEAHEKGFRGMNAVLYLDTNLVLPGDMLWKVDTASMRVALEVRVPFVDPEVARLAFALPSGWKLRGFARKWILRQVAARWLPGEILQRPKGGFGIPIGEWMRGELRQTLEDTLFSPEARRLGLEEEAVRRLWEAHQRRQRDHFWELWNLFVLVRWAMRWRVA